MFRIKLTKDKDGLAFKNDIWKNVSSLDISPVTVITGNNGSGKSALLKAIFLGQGGTIYHTNVQESKNESGYTCTLNYEIQTYGSITTDSSFEETFFHDPIVQIRGSGAVHNELDCTRVLGWRKSHGENLKNLLYRNWKLQFKIVNTLSLIDELESGLSLETLEKEVQFLQTLCDYVLTQAKQDTQPKRCIIIATQNPLVVSSLVEVGAMRLDLGNWENKDPFEKYLTKA